MILEELPIAATFLTPQSRNYQEPSRSSAEWVIKTCWPSSGFHFSRLFCFSVCVYIYLYVYIFGCLQKLEASGPLEPKLQKVVIHLTQVRRTKLGFSARAANVLTTMPSLQLPISLSYVWYLWGLSHNSYFHPRDVPRIKQSKNIAWRCWENWRWVRPGAQAYKFSYWTSNQLLGYRTSLRLAWTTYQDTVSR